MNRSMIASRGSPVCRRSGSTRFAADTVPLSLSFSRPMRSTSVMHLAVHVVAEGRVVQHAAVREALLRGAADLALRRGDVVERLIGRLDARASAAPAAPSRRGTRTSRRTSCPRRGMPARTASRSRSSSRAMSIAPPPEMRRTTSNPCRAAPSGSTSLRNDWNDPMTTADSSHSQRRSVGRRRPSPTRLGEHLVEREVHARRDGPLVHDLPVEVAPSRAPSRAPGARPCRRPRA